MPTSKKRINISMPDNYYKVLTKIAIRDDVPQATKALDLIKIALEFDEDEVWDTLAQKRDTRSAKFIPHKKAWL